MTTFAAAMLALLVLVPLTRAHLESFTYQLGDAASVEDGKVPLVNGKWTDPEGGSTFTLHPVHAIGDLDGDGNADAVAILVSTLR